MTALHFATMSVFPDKRGTNCVAELVRSTPRRHAALITALPCGSRTMALTLPSRTARARPALIVSRCGKSPPANPRATLLALSDPLSDLLCHAGSHPAETAPGAARYCCARIQGHSPTLILTTAQTHSRCVHAGSENEIRERARWRCQHLGLGGGRRGTG